MGCTPQEVPECYDELSSVFSVHADVPPVLLLHGTRDKCVSHYQSLTFYYRLRALGVAAEVEVYEDKPHGWFNHEPDRAKTIERMEQFLTRHFKVAPLA